MEFSTLIKYLRVLDEVQQVVCKTLLFLQCIDVKGYVIDPRPTLVKIPPITLTSLTLKFKLINKRYNLIYRYTLITNVITYYFQI